ncbi:MAG TPA: MFS transporter, partial [Myxococcota bacterium]
ERAFRPYVLGSTFFFCGFTVLQTGAFFFVTVLLDKPAADQALVVGPLFGVAALSFVAVAPLAKRFGKRPMMIFGALVLAVDMGVGIPLLHTMPGLAVPIFALGGLPIALFLALPNAMLADICEANAKRTGERREGMFFGAQGFLQKISLAIPAGAFSWLAEVFGKSVDNPFGVQLAGPLTAFFLTASALCFYLYPERDVQKAAAATT